MTDVIIRILVYIVGLVLGFGIGVNMTRQIVNKNSKKIADKIANSGKFTWGEVIKLMEILDEVKDDDD